MFLCTEWSAQVLLGGWNEEREVSTGLQDMEVTGVLSSGNESSTGVDCRELQYPQRGLARIP